MTKNGHHFPEHALPGLRQFGAWFEKQRLLELWFSCDGPYLRPILWAGKDRYPKDTENHLRYSQDELPQHSYLPCRYCRTTAGIPRRYLYPSWDFLIHQSGLLSDSESVPLRP